MINKLLEFRKALKERKPHFIRQDYGKRKKLSLKWKKPKGIHSKIRHHFKGRRKMPSPGYKSPKEVAGLHSSGSKIVNISSIKDIKRINKENEGIVISKKVGIRKKLEILRKAKELDIKVLNLNVDEQIKKFENIINSKKKENVATKKEEAKEEKKHAAEQSQQLTEKQKKDAEKRKKDKILTKRT